MDNTEEEACITRIKNGDPSPYAFIVDKYKYMAYTLALKVLGNAEDAQDAAQESFIKAYQQIKQFEGRAKFSTWLYTIVYRTAISKLKENRVKTISMSRAISDSYTQDYSIPQFEKLQVEDEQRYVKEAIQKLPTTEALLITLYYINENTISEICEITGLSYPNVKVKLFRARRILERELQFLVKNEINRRGDAK